jgi:hypothetical protein
LLFISSERRRRHCNGRSFPGPPPRRRAAQSRRAISSPAHRAARRKVLKFIVPRYARCLEAVLRSTLHHHILGEHHCPLLDHSIGIGRQRNKEPSFVERFNTESSPVSTRFWASVSLIRLLSLRSPACPQSGPPRPFRYRIYAGFRRKHFPPIRSLHSHLALAARAHK